MMFLCIKKNFLSFFKCPERLSLLHQITPSHFPFLFLGFFFRLARLLSRDWSTSLHSLFAISFGLIFPFLHNIKVKCCLASKAISYCRQFWFFWWTLHPFKMDTLENEKHKKLDIRKKMKAKKFFKECDLPQNDIIWSKMRTRLDEVKKMLLRFHATRKEHNTIHILKANFVSHSHTKYHFIRVCSLTHFYKQFCILHEFFVRFFTSFARLI